MARKDKAQVRIKLWQNPVADESGKKPVEIVIYKDETLLSSESIGLTTHEQLWFGVILEWVEGYERWFTPAEFQAELEDHSQIQRVRTWAKLTYKKYSA